MFRVFILTGFLVLYISLYSYAMDPDGCLTCHQYPGLVTHEKDGPFRILHIDEDAYLASPHGKTECRKCHIHIKQVPHTGERTFDCTTECHREDREKIEAIDLTASPIHRGEKFAVTSLQCGSSCRICHSLYPHSENRLVRAFNNMHAGFMFCEVCHLKKETWKDVIYDWGAPEPVEFSVQPYGMYQRHEPGTVGKVKNFISEICMKFSMEKLLPWKIEEGRYSIQRITAFFVENGKKRILMDTWDNRRAVEFRKKEQGMTAAEKKKELEYFHHDTAMKEISTACNECHTPKAGLLYYEQLGFDKTKINKLKRLNIKGLVTKYDTFYFPELLHPE